jgi:site-specific DNA recombinase
MNENLLASFTAAVEAEIAEGMKVHGQDRKATEKALKKVTGEIENMMKVIKSGFFTDSMREELTALEGRRAAMITELAEPAPAAPKIALPSDWQSSYRAAIDELEVSLADPESRDAAMTVLRDLIDKVVLEPGVGDTMRAKLSGVFPALLELAATVSRTSGKKKARRKSAGPSIASSCEMSVVAGRGFEPLTFRL